MSSIPEAFWSTTAQVIPTALLVLAVERRFTPRRPSRGMGRGYVIVLLFGVVSVGTLGEFFALEMLADNPRGMNPVENAQFVLFTLGLLLSVIVGVFVFGYLRDSLGEGRNVSHGVIGGGRQGAAADDDEAGTLEELPEDGAPAEWGIDPPTHWMLRGLASFIAVVPLVMAIAVAVEL